MKAALITLALLLLACAGCTGTWHVEPRLVPAGHVQTLPDIPAGRDTSATIIREKSGAEFHGSSNNTVVSGDRLQLFSTVNTISWGIWQLSPGTDELAGVEIVLDVPESSAAFIALANYSAGKWEIDGPLPAGKQYTLADASHRSPGGHVYVSVITAAGDSADVIKAVLTTDRTGWQIVTIDPDNGNYGYVGKFTSLAVVDDKPAISFYSDAAKDLMYARATTPTGGSKDEWGEVVTVDSGGEVGRYSSLAVIAGNPAISYYDETNGALKYARSTTATGNSGADWTQIVTVDTLNDTGYNTCLAVISGNPAIAYNSNSGEGLRYARATTGTGSSAESWSVPVTVDTRGDPSERTLLEVDGHPAIAFFDFPEQDLKYTRSDDSNGTSASDWSEIITIANVGSFADTFSMAIVLGNPAIAYFDDHDDSIKYKRSGTSTGTGFGAWDVGGATTIDNVDSTGRFCSLAVIDGRPAVSYQNNTARELLYKRSSRSTGDGFLPWSSGKGQVADQAFAFHTSMAQIDGKPAISYWDSEAGAVKYAILY